MEDQTKTVATIRDFNRFYTNILGLLNRHVLDSDYSLTEARILFELCELGRCSANTLCAKLHIDKSYLSRILTRFEKEGLLVKEASDQDGRINLLAPSAPGLATMQELAEKSNEQITQWLMRLNDSECGEIRAAMTTLKRHFFKATGAMVIRPYTKNDLAFVISRQIHLYETEYGFTTAAWKAYVTDCVHKLADHFDARKDCLYILEYNGVPAGCIAVAHAGDETAQLRFFFVEAELRGLGAGRQLIDLALAFCREKQYRHVFLLTCDQLDAARHLYRENGFRITSTEVTSDWGTTIVEERWDLDL